MKNQTIVYIGNKLSNSKNTTITVMETLSQNLIHEGYNVISVSNKKNKVFRLLEMLFTIIKYAKTTKYVLIDTYSTHNFYYAVIVGKICRWLKIPYIPILHGGNLPNRLENSKKLSQKLFKNSKTNVAPSKYLLEAFNKEGYKNITYIPNSISVSNYLFLPRKKIYPNLLWVRSFLEMYHPELALKILEDLLKAFPEATLCMVGPDKDGSLEKCQAIANEKKLPVIFTGKLSREDWHKKSQEYDIFINTTNIDNTPVSVIEAMALGFPVISTNVGGVPYLVNNQKDGWLVKPNSSSDFVNAIESLCNLPQLTKTLSENAREKAESFDWEKVKHLWFTLLEN